MTHKHTGIDGDILLYQTAFALEARGYIAYDEGDNPVAFSKYKKELKDYPRVEPYLAVEEENSDHCCAIFNSKVKRIVRKTGCSSYTIYITGKGNFRHELYENYKSTRKAKPILYQVVKEHALGLIHTELVEGQETDDALAIAQTNDPEGHIIATIDKDLLMVAGHHYHIDKEVFSYITPAQGMRNFYEQILKGDSIDNIPGIKGIGDKTATKILKDCTTEEDMWHLCLEKWSNILQHDSVLDTVIRNARLLWMRLEENQVWQPPR